ncbi:fibronectin type III domain-containing protein [Piscibacillus salipiscarius]|uniref:fibronectin type III domain-containing protein n=1 Tax=Piscibacillus salipiscarius TaxID=299480 RepID=UPI002436C705|nr:fibronectin type III domain-containing protein [Piscibacillus salipiscarius]
MAGLPNAPANLATSNVTDTTLSLTWDAVSYEAGIEHYEIYRDGASVGTSTTASFDDTGLTADTTYQYQVKAIATEGTESPLSDAVSVTTAPAV